jgi:hypothetical protein
VTKWKITESSAKRQVSTSRYKSAVWKLTTLPSAVPRWIFNIETSRKAGNSATNAETVLGLLFECARMLQDPGIHHVSTHLRVV